MFNKVLLPALLLVFVLGAAMSLPLIDHDAGFSPVTSVWAAPGCTDADGDGHDKYHRKWCVLGDDLDDSDPCNPVPEEGDPTYSSCGDGGTGTGGDLGSAISMDCVLVGEWEPPSIPYEPTYTIKGDTLGLDDQSINGTRYSDAVDKIDCSIDGPSTPWSIKLGMGVKGRPENSVRKVDVILADFESGGFGVDTRLGDHTDLDEYPSLFYPAKSDSEIPYFPDMDEMDPIRINVRPYRNEQTEEGIHLLTPGETYLMGLRFSIPGMERTTFSIASKWYEGNESFTGIGCETGFNQEILDKAPPVVDKEPSVMQDVSVYLWEDGSDADNLPDGYTISTETIVDPGEEGPPEVVVNPDAPRYAAVCSSIGPAAPCGNPRSPSNCNFLGYVPVQFTMHARVK